MCRWFNSAPGHHANSIPELPRTPRRGGPRSFVFFNSSGLPVPFPNIPSGPHRRRRHRRPCRRARAGAPGLSPCKVLEQSAQIGEIGAGIQLGPNAFSAFDALGIGERARARAVYTERLVMMDAVDESEVASVPVGEAFRERFGNPYAVSHRADVHQSLLEGVQRQCPIELVTSARVERVEQDGDGVTRDRRQGRARGRGADRLRRRQVERAPAARERPGARVGPRGVSRRGRRARLSRRPEDERSVPVGRARLPPGALPAARRRAVQRGGHLPQPQARGVGRDRGQPRRGDVVLRRHRPAPAPAPRPAEELEALGDRRPRADRASGPSAA